MLTNADVVAEDYVVEIGPGLGTLTQHLLDAGATVRAIEFDVLLAATLEHRLKFDKSKLIVTQADIMQFNFSDVPVGYKVVANIPYYLTSGLLRLLSEEENPPVVASLLVQKEVAERVCAEPGATSLLSITTQLFFETSLGPVVGAKLFTPPPKVDSQILVLKRRPKPLFGDLDEKLLFRVVKAGFSERRKKLRSSLSGGLGIPKDQADGLLAKAQINGDLRAQNLSLDDWIVLAKAWQNL
jgi:16S rRNA (adenine1518-N6/adenine1519-N6)-dimethyltransferase